LGKQLVPVAGAECGDLVYMLFILGGTWTGEAGAIVTTQWAGRPDVRGYEWRARTTRFNAATL